MENASGFINELNLTSTNPTTRIGSIYTLCLEDVANEQAMFTLTKFGNTVDTAVGLEGDTIFLNFEIVGADFTYAPAGDEMPPTVLTGELYPKLMMLLIGMFSVVSIRNHMHKMTRSLPLDILAVACGIAVLATAFVRGESDMAGAGIVLAGTGIGAAVGKMLLMDSHLHDFVGMLVVFVTARYIVMQVPEWSFMVVVGTLVGYYAALNLYHGSGEE